MTELDGFRFQKSKLLYTIQYTHVLKQGSPERRVMPMVTWEEI